MNLSSCSCQALSWRWEFRGVQQWEGIIIKSIGTRIIFRQKCTLFLHSKQSYSNELVVGWEYGSLHWCKHQCAYMKGQVFKSLWQGGPRELLHPQAIISRSAPEACISAVGMLGILTSTGQISSSHNYSEWQTHTLRKISKLYIFRI